MRTIILSLTFILVTSIIINLIFIFKYIWKQGSRVKRFFQNTTILIFTIFYLLFTLELFFYNFVIQTDSRGGTLAARKWFAKYWRINSLGLRDEEYTDNDFQGKRVVFCVGDSVTAGQGIKNPKDRFSGLLADKLGRDYLVVNIAKCGWDTNNEYKAITSYPRKPWLIILTYLPNDIETAGSYSGRKKPIVIGRPAKIIRPVIRYSYFLNFVFSRLALYNSSARERKYWEYIKGCYTNGKIWAGHKQELSQIINYAKKDNAGLIVAFFPCADIVVNRLSAPLVCDFVRSEGARAVDLTPYFSGRNPAELAVSRFDNHSNEKVNREIADILLGEIADYASKLGG